VAEVTLRLTSRSRSSPTIPLFNVPAPLDVVVRFVYNFFLPDERINSDGVPRYQGQGTLDDDDPSSVKDAELELPRYIEIHFTPAPSAAGDDTRVGTGLDIEINSNSIIMEESTVNETNLAINYKDPHVKKRMENKAELLAGLLDVDPLTSPSNKAQRLYDSYPLLNQPNPTATMGIEEYLQQIFEETKIGFVNQVGEFKPVSVFVKASQMTINSTLFRKAADSIVGGNYAVQDPNKQALINEVSNSSFYRERPDEQLHLTHITESTADDPNPVIGTNGYIIIRREKRADGTAGENRRYFLQGRTNTRFIDTEILYGSVYSYSVRRVIEARVVTSHQGGGARRPYNKATFLIASEPSTIQSVEASENIPPIEPDGVFYRFNYDDGAGLFIKWQIPSGRQRDVKYFQVFRRKTIENAYECIAEIDFDNSEVKSPKREFVLPARRIKASAPVTMFLDTGFDRDSDYIYAVVALDAHGLTSGYSAQSRVGFDRRKNRLTLQNISRSGAPKQYPNFFVDPKLDDNIHVNSLTQDAMMTSRRRRAKVYFDPDLIQYDTQALGRVPLLATDKISGFYKLLLINTDRQKSADADIVIEDMRSPPDPV